MAPTNAMAADLLDSLPDEVLSHQVLSLLSYSELSRVSLINKRVSKLTPCCKLWKALFVERWGSKELYDEAAQLAGSWRAFFKAKHFTDAGSNGWNRPSEFELRAVLHDLARRSVAAASSTMDEDTSDHMCCEVPPDTPKSLLSCSPVLSPAPSTSIGSPTMRSSLPGSPSMLNNFMRHASLSSASSVLPGSPVGSPCASWQFATAMAGFEAGHDSIRSTAVAATHPPEVQMVYLLDGSGSVSEEDFAEMKRFVLTSAPILASALGAPGHGKVGVVQFSTEPRVEVPLASIGPTTEQLSAALDAIVRINGGTNIASAIARAGAMMKAEDQAMALTAAAANTSSQPMTGEAMPGPSMSLLGSSSSVKHHVGHKQRPARLVLLLTDGRVDAYQGREARTTACRLADELCGCLLAAFGVGRGVDRSELLNIIDTPHGDAASRYLDLYTRDDAPW